MRGKGQAGDADPSPGDAPSAEAAPDRPKGPESLTWLAVARSKRDLPGGVGGLRRALVRYLVSIAEPLVPEPAIKDWSQVSTNL